jgi:signal peptidase I
MKKVIKYFSFGLLILLMTAAVLSFLAPRFGWGVDAVLSGSMEPQLKVGGLVITRPVESKDIEVGDTITFYCPLNKGMTSHRVIAVESGTLSYFRTKGDANEDPDPFIVPVQNVAGKVCFHIPYLGFVIQFLKTPLGMLLTLGIPGLIIIALEIINIWRVFSEEKKRISDEGIGR